MSRRHLPSYRLLAHPSPAISDNPNSRLPGTAAPVTHLCRIVCPQLPHARGGLRLVQRADELGKQVLRLAHNLLAAERLAGSSSGGPADSGASEQDCRTSERASDNLCMSCISCAVAVARSRIVNTRTSPAHRCHGFPSKMGLNASANPQRQAFCRQSHPSRRLPHSCRSLQTAIPFGVHRAASAHCSALPCPTGAPGPIAQPMRVQLPRKR